MEKFKLTVTRKNGNKKKVAVYIDDHTAQLLRQTGDKKLINAYLLEEYKERCKTRQEEFWNHSLEEDMENGIDYEDKRSNIEFLLNDFADENLQAAIKQLTPRQQEVLRLVYIEGRTQQEVGEILHRAQSSINENLQTIYKRIREILDKNKKYF